MVAMQNYEVMFDYYDIYRMYTYITSSSQNKNKGTPATIMNLFGHKFM
jgi:hypothetical protein